MAYILLNGEKHTFDVKYVKNKPIEPSNAISFKDMDLSDRFVLGYLAFSFSVNPPRNVAYGNLALILGLVTKHAGKRLKEMKNRNKVNEPVYLIDIDEDEDAD